MVSKRKKVFDFIASQKSDKDGWVKMTNRMLAEKLDMEVPEVQQIAGSLKNTGNIDTRIEDGKVTAFRIVGEAPKWRRVINRRQKGPRIARAKASSNVVNFLKTPNTDRYAHAKATFERMLADEDVRAYVAAEWKPDPTAEEALSLKTQLQAVTERLNELRGKYAEEHRELEYLRKTRDEQFRGALKTAGVVHADQPAAEAAG